MGADQNGARVLQWIVGLGFTSLVGVGIAIAGAVRGVEREVQEVQIRLASIEANRWTSRDQADFLRWVNAELGRKADTSGVPPDIVDSAFATAARERIDIRRRILDLERQVRPD